MEEIVKIPDGCKIESVYKEEINGKDAIVLIVAPELPPKPGDLCIFWDDIKYIAVISILKEIASDTFYPFKATTGIPFKHCIKYRDKEQYLKCTSSEP